MNPAPCPRYFPLALSQPADQTVPPKPSAINTSTSPSKYATSSPLKSTLARNTAGGALHSRIASSPFNAARPARLRQSSTRNSRRLISLADPHKLTCLFLYRCKNRGGGGFRPCPPKPLGEGGQGGAAPHRQSRFHRCPPKPWRRRVATLPLHSFVLQFLSRKRPCLTCSSSQDADSNPA